MGCTPKAKKTGALFLRAGSAAQRKRSIMVAAGIIRAGGIVAFPTETVYGLGANALDTRAVRKVFRAKSRPFDDPLIVHISDGCQLYGLVEKVDLRTKFLVQKFWPGPLTLVLKKSRTVPGITTAGLGTVAVRMPANKTALQLIAESGCPIAAPSANLFGKPSPTDAEHVKEDLGGRIDAIIDGGRTRIGMESTVLDISGRTPTLLRPGGISLERLQKAIGRIRVHRLVRNLGLNRSASVRPVKSPVKKTPERLTARSPGMKYRHYAPEAEVVLVLGKNAGNKIMKILDAEKGRGTTGAILARKPRAATGNVVAIGSAKGEFARNVYAGLREFDRGEKRRVKKILVDCSLIGSEKGIGLAVKNRLLRAAGRIIKSG